MCQSVVKKCHKCLMTIFLVSDSLFLQYFWDFFKTICALLSQSFNVEIDALFPQFFCDLKADSAIFFAFRMYALVLPPQKMTWPPNVLQILVEEMVCILDKGFKIENLTTFEQIWISDCDISIDHTISTTTGHIVSK